MGCLLLLEVAFIKLAGRVFNTPEGKKGLDVMEALYFSLVQGTTIGFGDYYAVVPFIGTFFVCYNCMIISLLSHVMGEVCTILDKCYLWFTNHDNFKYVVPRYHLRQLLCVIVCACAVFTGAQLHTRYKN